MTARRDPGAPSDEPDSGDGPARRLLPPLPRAMARPDVIAKRIVAVLVLVGLIGWAVSVLGARAGRWLHARPEYSISFDSIQLDPPPPDYILGGRKTILARVRDKAKLDEPIPVLDQDLEELGRLFAKYSPWVAKVERVRLQYPDRVTVQLAYREPVAMVDRKNLGMRDLAISADGVALPGEEVVPKEDARLVRLADKSVDWNVIPGRLVAMNERGEVAPEVLAVLRLARFLRAQDGLDGSRAVIATLHPSKGADTFWVITKRRFKVYWEHAPGDEAEGEPTADEKLQRVAKWELEHPNELPNPAKGLRFTTSSIEYRPLTK